MQTNHGSFTFTLQKPQLPENVITMDWLMLGYTWNYVLLLLRPQKIQNCASTEILSSPFLEFCLLSLLAVVVATDTFLQHLPTGSLCYCSHNSCICISLCCAGAQPALPGSSRLLHPLTTGGTAIELPLLAPLGESHKHLRDFLGC